MKLRYFENTAIFIQKLKITGATYMIEGYMEFGACNDENCLPPVSYTHLFMPTSLKWETCVKPSLLCKEQLAVLQAVIQAISV